MHERDYVAFPVQRVYQHANARGGRLQDGIHFAFQLFFSPPFRENSDGRSGARAVPAVQRPMHCGKREREATATSVINDIANEFLCPITRELPVDPVTAEDGRVYERSAITKWCKMNQEVVRSPVTSEPMGRKLLPAVQVRNTIKGLVQSGALSGDKANAWKQRIEDEELVADLRRKAETGDIRAMANLGRCYNVGQGIAKDPKQAFVWFERAADKDDIDGLTECGLAYLEGSAVEQKYGNGMLMTARAAEMGSEHACFVIGYCFETGYKAVFEKDAQEATKWYKKMKTCGLKNSRKKWRDHADAFVLAQLTAAPPAPVSLAVFEVLRLIRERPEAVAEVKAVIARQDLTEAQKMSEVQRIVHAR